MDCAAAVWVGVGIDGTGLHYLLVVTAGHAALAYWGGTR